MTSEQAHERHLHWEEYAKVVEGVEDYGDDFLRLSTIERLRASGVEFSDIETYMEHSLFRLHAFFAVTDWMIAKDIDLSNFNYYYFGSFIGWMTEHLGEHDTLIPYTSICDRDRVAEALRETPDKHAAVLQSIVTTLPIDTSPPEEQREALRTYLTGFLGNTVDVQVIAKGRVVAMSQMVGDSTEVRRYKGGSGLDGLSLGECGVHENNLVIIKKAEGKIPEAEQVIKVTNGFKTKLVKLTSTKDTTPKGEEQAVYTVFSVAPRILTGSDLLRSWEVSLVDPPEPEPEPEPTPVPEPEVEVENP